MIPHGVRRAVAVPGLLVLLAGCAAARREAGGWVVRGKGYRVTVPEGWEPMPSAADLAFRRRDLGAGLMAHGTCDARTPTRLPAVLARHLRFGLREVRELEEAPVDVAGQPGLRSRFAARLDGAPVAVRAIVLRGPRCVYDLVVVGPPGRLAEAGADFERFVASFALVGEGRP